MWVALQTLLKIKVTAVHIWHFKSNFLQNKSQIRILSTISLTSVSIVHGALKTIY